MYKWIVYFTYSCLPYIDVFYRIHIYYSYDRYTHKNLYVYLDMLYICKYNQINILDILMIMIICINYTIYIYSIISLTYMNLHKKHI